MTLGALRDMLAELAEAESDVRDAELALTHGGSPKTMWAKEQDLERAKAREIMIREYELQMS